MGGHVEHGRLVPEEVLGAVAVVDVPVDDEHTLAGVDQGTGRHGHVVQEAEAHGPVGRGVVAGWTGRDEHRRPVLAGRLDGHEPGSGGHPGVLPGRRSGIGVRVDGTAAGGAELLEALEVGRRVHAYQPLGRCRRGLHDDEVAAEVEVLDAPHGRTYPGRPLGVPRVAVVTGFERFDDDQHGTGSRGFVPAPVTVWGSARRTSPVPRGRGRRRWRWRRCPRPTSAAAPRRPGGTRASPVVRSHRRTAAAPSGGSTRTGPKSIWSSSKTRVGTPNAPRDATRSCSAFTSSPVVGSAMAWATRPGSSPISTRSSSATSARCGLRPSSWRALPAVGVPAVEERHVLATQQGADAHHRPAVGPLPFPGVLLALPAVDLLETEEPPPDVEAGLLTDVPDPEGRLVGVGAHDVEVEVDTGGSGRTVGAHGVLRGRGPTPEPGAPSNRTLAA